MSDEEEPTNPGRPLRRPASVATRRFVDQSLRPILERWLHATDDEARDAALAAFLDEIASEGQRRREDLERENERLLGELNNAKTAVSLAEQRATRDRETIAVLREENGRLRGARVERSKL